MRASTEGKQLLVIGVGNTLRGDDGVGVRVAQALADRPLPEGVAVLDGGTEGLDLLYHLETADRVILIDGAVMGKAPGEVRVFGGELVHATPEVRFSSTHGFGVAEVLTLGRSIGVTPEVTVVGIQPGELGPRDGLSEALESHLTEYVKLVEGLIASDREGNIPPYAVQGSDISGEDPRR